MKLGKVVDDDDNIKLLQMRWVTKLCRPTLFFGVPILILSGILVYSSIVKDRTVVFSKMFKCPETISLDNLPPVHSKPRVLWKECPFVRFTYKCSGEKYTTFLDIERKNIQERETFLPRVFPRDILFVGNSHVGQLAEEMLCLNHDSIIEFAGTDLSTGCLTKPEISKESGCDGHGSRNSCGMYIARAKLAYNNRSAWRNIYLANNHPLLFTGEKGISQLFDTILNISGTDLGAIVLGEWNSVGWANSVFTQEKVSYPVPHWGQECGSKHEDFVEKIPDVVGHFKKQGFHGFLYKYENPRAFPSHESVRERKLGSNNTCFVGDCTGGPSFSHLCIPGNGIYTILDLLEDLG